MSTLEMPEDLSAPFFVYGMLKPQEIAHSFIEPYIKMPPRRATAKGGLLLRDGIPILDPTLEIGVEGFLIEFMPDKRYKAWTLIIQFEPGNLYRLERRDVIVDDGTVSSAYILVGRSPRVGSSVEQLYVWRSTSDPAFSHGLDQVATLVKVVSPEGFRSRPDTPELWRDFYQIQAAYLLLWSIVERYTALKYGPSLDPFERVKLLDIDDAFINAVRQAGAVEGSVVDSRDPSTRYKLRKDGGSAAKYWYAVRSNLGHRGKSAFRDGRLVLKCAVELHDTMRFLFANRLTDSSDSRNLAGSIQHQPQCVLQDSFSEKAFLDY